MIRPVLNGDLPRVIRVIDQWARAQAGKYADFIVAPPGDEPRGRLSTFLSVLLPFVPNASTWILEDHWQLQGLIQTRARPGSSAWDVAYLAAVLAHTGDQQDAAILVDCGPVVYPLLQHCVNTAITRGVRRVFARVEDERPEIEQFTKLGFQRYAVEHTWALRDVRAGLRMLSETDDLARTPRGGRLWRGSDRWNLLRLHDAATPKRVQLAEDLDLDEFLHTRMFTWGLAPLLPLDPTGASYVLDHDGRLSAWLRLRSGRGTQPHEMALMAHPEDAGAAVALLRFGLEALASKPAQPVWCVVRDYEAPVILALRAAGFTPVAAHALLVRHQAARVMPLPDAAVAASRVVLGGQGIGSSQARMSKGEKAQYAESHA